MNKSLLCACLLVLLLLHAQAADKANALSPDGRWRYELSEGHWPVIHETSGGTRVLDLTIDSGRSAPHCYGREVVWSPDSKRFAFNYSPPHIPHSTYVVTAIYQLQGDKWVLLQSPVDEDFPSKTFAALLKHLPKGVERPRRWREDANRLVCKVREWPDAETAMLYIYAAGRTSGGGDFPSRFLFTLKFDAKGNCKVTHAQKAPEDLGD